jgi:PadR family transcriptional regulator, regulatory protein PadR
MAKGYLSYTMALILQALDNGYKYGLEVMTVTGLASGTVYPALRRLEDAGYVDSKWEKQSIAVAEQRPARKYYEVTKEGREALAEARKKYRLLDHLEQSAPKLKPAGGKG